MLDKDKYKHTEITEKIIGAYYAVYNQLGYGFFGKGIRKCHVYCVELVQK